MDDSGVTPIYENPQRAAVPPSHTSGRVRKMQRGSFQDLQKLERPLGSRDWYMGPLATVEDGLEGMLPLS